LLNELKQSKMQQVVANVIVVSVLVVVSVAVVAWESAKVVAQTETRHN